jgi:hypothetical protein
MRNRSRSEGQRLVARPFGLVLRDPDVQLSSTGFYLGTRRGSLTSAIHATRVGSFQPSSPAQV